MKTLSQIKWMLVILFSCLAIILVSTNCTPERGTEVERPVGGDDGDDADRTRGALTCKLPSGNGSCEKKDKCVDWCEDELDLSGDARDKCFDLDDETVKDLVYFFDDVFESPDDETLDDLNDEDIELICAAVKELEYEVLDNRLDYSNKAKAQYVLEWVAKTKEAIEIFENAEDDKGLKMFKKLLSRAGGNSGTGDKDVLEGLAINVASDNDDNKNVLQVALDENNDRLVEYIHHDIIADEDELCSSTNQPTPKSSCTAIETGSTSVDTYGGADADAGDYTEEACILGVYCKMAHRDIDDDNEFRKDIAEYLKHRNIANFIEESIDEGGGLGRSEDDADDWTYNVCKQLNDCWEFKSGFTIN